MKPINTQMSLVDNTTYTGKDALGFYSIALLEGEFVKGIKLVPDVKSKIKMANLNLSGILQESDCAFTDAGLTTLGQKTLEVCPVKINMEFCTRDFEVNYLSEQLKAGSLDAQIPQSFQEYVLNEIMKHVRTDVDNIAINGDILTSPAGTLSLCDGFRKKWLADATVIDVTGATLSASNIMAKVADLYNAVPNTIAANGLVKFYFSVAASKFYRQALVATNPALIAVNGSSFELSYLGIPIEVVKHLPTNEMFAAEPENLWFGTDLIGDLEDILVIPQRDKSGAPTVRIVGEMKIGFEYGNGSEIAWMH